MPLDLVKFYDKSRLTDRLSKILDITYNRFSVWTFLYSILNMRRTQNYHFSFHFAAIQPRQTRRFSSIGKVRVLSSLVFPLNLSQRKYFWTAIKRNFSIKSSESKTAMWAARPGKKYQNEINFKSDSKYFQPIRELVLLGRAWWTS